MDSEIWGVLVRELLERCHNGLKSGVSMSKPDPTVVGADVSQRLQDITLWVNCLKHWRTI